MNARQYDLNAKAAIEASSGGNRLNQPGAYDGKILFAFYDKNNNGTESFNFVFESDEGQVTPVISLYTHKANGEELLSFNMLNALITCVRQKSLSATKDTLKLYDFDRRDTVPTDKMVYKSLTNAPIGVVFRQEEYLNNNQELKKRLLLAGVYEKATRMVAVEILQRHTKATALDRLIEYVNQNPVKPLKGSERPRLVTGHDMNRDDQFSDDDIPF